MKAVLQEQARVLRKQGKSIKEIATELSISPNSASRWCAQVHLSPEQQRSLERKRKEAGLKALKPWIEKNRELRRVDIEKQQKLGAQDVGALSERDLLMLGLGLYWGEGYKRGSQEWGGSLTLTLR